MKRTFTKQILLSAVVIFLVGAVLGIVSVLLGGSFLRATDNLDNPVISFDFSTPEPTPEPYNMYDDFFGMDIFDIFEQFGLDDDFFSPYGGSSGNGSNGQIY